LFVAPALFSQEKRPKLTPAHRFEISTAMSTNARRIAQHAEDTARRAKDSQELARQSEEEAKEVALTAIYLKADYDKWCGLGVFFSDMI
jgi:hypothetical protein